MMLMLKKLVLKMVKKYINIYNYKLSLLGRDDTKQAKTVIFYVVPPSRTISKSTKKKKKKKMLDVVRTYSNSNNKLT